MGRIGVRYRFSIAHIFAGLMIAAALAATAADKRSITEKDILKFHWVADPRISPDGRQVAYVLVTVNEKEDRYETSIWRVETSGIAAPQRLTGGPRAADSVGASAGGRGARAAARPRPGARAHHHSRARHLPRRSRGLRSPPAR